MSTLVAPPGARPAELPPHRRLRNPWRFGRRMAGNPVLRFYAGPRTHEETQFDVFSEGEASEPEEEVQQPRRRGGRFEDADE